MRIIAGQHGGRHFLPPRDNLTTRPIIGHVKEALFNRLMSLGMLQRVDEGGQPWRAADVFSGTGSLGLEALSRGAEHCTFVERDKDAADRLHRNLDDLGLRGRATVIVGSAVNPIWLGRLGGRPLRLAFVDPPYAMMRDTADRHRLASLMARLLGHLEPGGVVTLRTHEDDPPLPPRTIAESHPPAEPPPDAGTTPTDLYDGPASFTYGTTTLHFYQRPLPDEAPRTSMG